MKIFPYLYTYKQECINLAEKVYGKDHPISKNIKNELKRYGEKFKIILKNNKVVGVGCYEETNMDYGVYEISHMMIDPDFRHQGLGKELLDNFIREIKDKDGRAILLCATPLSLNMYMKAGFVVIQMIGTDPLMILHLNGIT